MFYVFYIYKHDKAQPVYTIRFVLCHDDSDILQQKTLLFYSQVSQGFGLA